MKNIGLTFISLFALLSFGSCSSDDDGTNDSAAHERVKFTLESEAPVAEYPNAQVGYTFTVEYSAGLSRIVTTIDGVEVEGSRLRPHTSSDIRCRYRRLDRQSISSSRPRVPTDTSAASTIRYMSMRRRPTLI